jgi:hypothetical protein
MMLMRVCFMVRSQNKASDCYKDDPQKRADRFSGWGFTLDCPALKPWFSIRSLCFAYRLSPGAVK